MAARPSTPSSWHFRDESGGFAIIYGGKPLKRKRAAGAALVASISYPDGDDKTVIKVSINNNYHNKQILMREFNKYQTKRDNKCL